MPAPKTLFDKTTDFNGQPYRNITTLRESEDLFDDLTDGDEAASAIAAEPGSRWTAASGLRDQKKELQFYLSRGIFGKHGDTNRRVIEAQRIELKFCFDCASIAISNQ